MSFWNEMNKISEAYQKMQFGTSTRMDGIIVAENLTGELFRALRQNHGELTFNGRYYTIPTRVGMVEIHVEKGDGTDCGKSYARDLRELFLALGSGLTGFVGADNSKLDSINFSISNSIGDRISSSDDGNNKIVTLEPGRYDAQFLGENGDRFTIIFDIDKNTDFQKRDVNSYWH